MTEEPLSPAPEIDPDRRQLLRKLEERLDVRLRDVSLLNLALTHGSFTHEWHTRSTDTYERLEFLGDAVLNLVVSDHLFRRLPERAEGDLARARARLVNEPTLAEIARALDLGSFLRLGRGEDRGGGRDRNSMLADVLEAVVGAVYIDAGFGVAHAVVTCLYAELMADLEDPGGDFKSQLQEIMQQREKRLPRYRITSAEGPDHAKAYLAIVEIGGSVLGEGRGKSKKEAEQAAAEAALERLGAGTP